MKKKRFHFLSEIDAEKKTALCAHCGPVRLRGMGRKKNGDPHFRCAVAHQQAKKGHKWRRKRPPKPGICPICAKERGLVWDHCHRTGEHRGDICRQCNTVLGLMGDRPEALRAAASYLEASGLFDKAAA